MIAVIKTFLCLPAFFHDAYVPVDIGEKQKKIILVIRKFKGSYWSIALASANFPSPSRLETSLSLLNFSCVYS
jgi:hypothetical protein